MKKQAMEIEAVVNRKGRIEISLAANPIGAKPGSTVTVRIVPGRISDILADRDVTNEEIDRIASVQCEGRENVIRFMESEGALAHSPSFLARGLEIVR